MFAPLATLGIGLGFFMLHNTLQTEGTQMAPEARGTSLALFASMYFLGQTAGVALAAPVMDRYRRAAAVRRFQPCCCRRWRSGSRGD